MTPSSAPRNGEPVLGLASFPAGETLAAVSVLIFLQATRKLERRTQV